MIINIMISLSYGVDDIERERTLGIDPLTIDEVLVLHKYVRIWA